jgi:NADPH:quinone reductase-like Zn-dependent oxidoreductase
MGTFARMKEFTLTKTADDLSRISASSLPVVYATAYAALYDTANIQKGETVLIHAGAGGVG